MVPPAGGAEADWSKLAPGKYVLCWFSDDTVWHEMLVTAVARRDYASVWTPDEDHFV